MKNGTGMLNFAFYETFHGMMREVIRRSVVLCGARSRNFGFIIKLSTALVTLLHYVSKVTFLR